MVKLDFYSLKVDEVIKKLNSSKSGLSYSKVKELHETLGFNEIIIKKTNSFMSFIISQFKNFLVWLLIIITLFSFIVGFYFDMSELLVDGVIISIIIIFNVLVGAFQDYKSEKISEDLNSMIDNIAVVKREGVTNEVEARDLVLGDIILLKEGNKVPADCRIISSNNFSVDESMLTGESLPVHKSNAVLNQNLSISDQKNMLFTNTLVLKGDATAIVVKIGKNTEAGKIIDKVNSDTDLPFLKEVDSAAKSITVVALVLIFIALVVLYLYGMSFVSIFMIGAALIIGSIPEGLPAIITFTLSVASMKLSKVNVLIKRKSLLETLGGIDIICSDKTGTLTQNYMTLSKTFLAFKVIDSKDSLEDIQKVINPKILDLFHKSTLLANNSQKTDDGYIGDPEDLCFVDYFSNLSEDYSISKIRSDCPQESFEPFSSDSKQMSSVNIVEDKHIKYIKGAPEVIIQNCTHFIDKDGSIKKINSKIISKIEDKLNEFSNDALRCIAFSYSYSNQNIYIGFSGILDAPKEGVEETIKQIYSAGIDIKMITGDNLVTAIAIAKKCGFKHISGVSWHELENISEEEFITLVNKSNVFARIPPEMKYHIVSALQDSGKRVAITGDGVNDAPALKKAEVGIAMGLKGSDIAKDASDMIILDDNLSSIVSGVKEGRTIFANIKKVFNYLLTANLAEVLVVFLGALVGLVPFSAIQLLWVNFVTDVAPALSLGVDPPHKDILKIKPTGKNEKIIDKRLILLTVFIGIKKIILLFLIFIGTLKFTNDLILAQTMTFTWLVMSHFVRIAAIRFDEKMSFFVNKYLLWSMFIPILFQLVILYTPLSDLFHVVSLSLVNWLVLILFFILAIFLAKLITLGIDYYLRTSEKLKPVDDLI